jgi:hypothetical protein
VNTPFEIMVHTMPIDTISLRDSLSCACSQSSEPLSNWVDWVSLIASLATLICFAITCFQIYQVKSVGKQVWEAVKDNNHQIKNSISLYKVTDALRLTEMVFDYIRKEHYELAAIKLFELNNMAIEIAANHKELKAYQLSLLSEVDHLNDMATNEKSMYSPSYTISTIMQFNNALKDIDIKIKNQIIKIDRT